PLQLRPIKTSRSGWFFQLYRPPISMSFCIVFSKLVARHLTRHPSGRLRRRLIQGLGGSKLERLKLEVVRSTNFRSVDPHTLNLFFGPTALVPVLAVQGGIQLCKRGLRHSHGLKILDAISRLDSHFNHFFVVAHFRFLYGFTPNTSSELTGDKRRQLNSGVRRQVRVWRLCM